MQDVLGRSVCPATVAWDVGANVGFYTLALSKLVGSSGHVVAFEPDGLNAAYLLQHVQLNKLTNVTLVQAAVSNESGIVSFSVGAAGTNGSIVNGSCNKIPSISLDDFIEAEGGPPPDLVKIDVEGAEANVLKGAACILSRYSPVLVIALHNKQATLQCTHLLHEAGYEIANLNGRLLHEVDCDEIVAKKADKIV